ncbi:uncharacterized protein J3D65DRAFT_628295 [Phyllosticta citribraziliensis]|uniref:FAD/NAD(P)-binding domain-containing protein n=1 Tax=Phyllosticta citribraziliensis TaxID=989973 RepID=A0ABR1LMC7_9PEZI
MSAETHNIVVLGASWSGLSAAHYTLKHILPKLANSDTYHVYLINSSPDFYWRVAGPRAAVSAQLMPDDKVLYPIAPGFAQYDSKHFTFIVGTATAWDPTARSLTLDTAGGQQQVLPYHALVVATGTRTPTPLLSLHATAEETKNELSKIRTALTSAQTVLIAGGGPAGVETAGEVGELLNGPPGWFSSGPKTRKATITVVTADSKLLPALRPALASKAELFLSKVGVDVKKNVRVESATPAADGQTTVSLSNGETQLVDVYIAATGVRPNTAFVPAHLLTDRGYLSTNAQTLRVDAAGPRVFALGDVGSYTRGGIMDIYDAVPVAMTNLARDLGAYSADKPDAAPAGPDRTYTPNLKETQLVPVGQSKGVGAVFGWKLPSMMVWAIKGRDYMVSNAGSIVEGSKWAKESSWKPTDS